MVRRPSIRHAGADGDAARMIVLGLTGSIGMGKTTVTAQFRTLGAKTYNADEAVHALLRKGGKGVEPVAKLFPQTLENGYINREILGKAVFDCPDLLRRLESVIHPLVREYEWRFICRVARQGARLVVLDIPLLFETQGERRCDLTLVVTSPPFIQNQRVMARPRMTPEKLTSILKLQMPDREKRKRADVVIYTGLGKAYSFAQVKQLVQEMQCHGKSRLIRKRRG